MTPPTAKDAARRLLILLAIKAHALRLMMIWDFTFQMRETLRAVSRRNPEWGSLGAGGWWLRARAKWNWWWERRTVRRALATARLLPYLTGREREFFRLRLSKASRDEASQYLWQIEGAACIAWALRVLPRVWPMDESFDGELDPETLGSSDLDLVGTAILRPAAELEAVRERIQHWHWRARQFSLERQGYPWPPPDATPEQVADLESKGLGTIDGIVRTTTRFLAERGILEETLDGDFVAKGRAYREASEDDAAELLSIATERHRALNWLSGIGADWDTVPTET